MTIKNIQVSYSKHLGNRYPNEQIMTDNCGSCDGALCDYCTKTYEVLGKRFKDEDAAKEFAESAAADLIELTGVAEIVESVVDPIFFINNDGMLFVKWWSWEKSHVEVIVNTAAKLYPETLATAVKRRADWVSCPCVDKDDERIGDCSIFGCNDSLCRHQVDHCGRVNKKWYM